MSVVRPVPRLTDPETSSIGRIFMARAKERIATATNKKAVFLRADLSDGAEIKVSNRYSNHYFFSEDTMLITRLKNGYEAVGGGRRLVSGKTLKVDPITISGPDGNDLIISSTNPFRVLRPVEVNRSIHAAYYKGSWVLLSLDCDSIEEVT